jgi:hypothetical protein
MVRRFLFIILFSVMLLSTGCTLALFGIQRDENIRRLKFLVLRDPNPSKSLFAIYDGHLPGQNMGIVQLASWESDKSAPAVAPK